MFLVHGSAMCAITTRTSLVSLFRRNSRDNKAIHVKSKIQSQCAVRSRLRSLHDNPYSATQWKKKQSSTCLADRTRSKWIITKVSKFVQSNASETNEAPTNPQQGDQQDEAVVMSLEELIVHSLADRCIELGITPTITPGQSKHLDWIHDSSVNEQGLVIRAWACSDLDAVVKLALGADQEAHDCFRIFATIFSTYDPRAPLNNDFVLVPERCKGLVAALKGLSGVKDHSWKGLVEISGGEFSPTLRILVDVKILKSLTMKLGGIFMEDSNQNPTGKLLNRSRVVFDFTAAVLCVFGSSFFRQPGPLSPLWCQPMVALSNLVMVIITSIGLFTSIGLNIIKIRGILSGMIRGISSGTADLNNGPQIAKQVVLDWVFKHQYIPESYVITILFKTVGTADMRTSLSARIADMSMDAPSRPLLLYLFNTTYLALRLFKESDGKESVSAAEASLWLQLLVDSMMTYGKQYSNVFKAAEDQADMDHRMSTCISALFDSHSSSPGTVDLGALVLASLQLVAGVKKNTELRVKALAHMPEFLNDLSLGHFPYFYPSDLLQLMFSIMENSSPKSDGKDISYSSQYLQALVHVLSSSFFQPWLNSDATEGDRLRVADIISKCILSAPSLLENDPSLITSTPIMRDNNVMHLAHKAYQLSGLTGALTPEAYNQVIAFTAREGNILYLKEYLFDFLHSISSHPSQRSHDQRTSRRVHKSSFSLEEGLLSITQNLSASILPELLHGCPSRQYHCDICSGLLSASITSVSASWTLASLEAIDNICANDRTHNKLIITPSQVSSLAKSFLSGGNQKESSLDSEGQYDPTSIGYKAALLAFKIMLYEEDRQLKAAGADVHHSSPHPILRELPSGLAPTSRHLLSQALLYNRDSQFDHLRYLCLQLSPTQQTAVAWLTEYCERNADPSCSTSKSVVPAGTLQGLALLGSKESWLGLGALLVRALTYLIPGQAHYAELQCGGAAAVCRLLLLDALKAPKAAVPSSSQASTTPCSHQDLMASLLAFLETTCSSSLPSQDVHYAEKLPHFSSTTALVQPPLMTDLQGNPDAYVLITNKELQTITCQAIDVCKQRLTATGDSSGFESLTGILNLAVCRVMSQLSAATPADASEDATVEGAATGMREVLIYIKQVLSKAVGSHDITSNPRLLALGFSLLDRLQALGWCLPPTPHHDKVICIPEHRRQQSLVYNLHGQYAAFIAWYAISSSLPATPKTAAIASASKHDSKSAQSIVHLRLVPLVAQLCQALTASDAYNGNSQRLVDSSTESSHQMSMRTSWLHKLPEEAPYYQSLVFITQVCVQHVYAEPVKEVLRLCSSLLGKNLKVPREIALLSLSMVSEWAESDEGDEGSELGDVCLQILGVGSAFWEKDSSDYIHHMENILSEELNGANASELLNVLMHVPSQLDSDSADCNWSSKSKARALLVTAEVMTSRITEFKTLASFKLCMNARISAAEHAKMYSSLTGGSKQQAMMSGSWQGGFQYVDDVSRKTKSSQASNLADDLLSPEYHSSQAAQLLQIKVLLPYMKWENGLVEHVVLTPTVETYALFMAVHEAGHQPIMAVEMAHQILTAQLPLTNTYTGQRLTCQDKAKSTKDGRQADVQTSCTEESFHAYWKVVETAVCIANRCCMHTASLLLLIQFMRQFGRLRHGEAVSKALSSVVSEGTPLYTLHNRLIESIWEAVGEESFYELQEGTVSPSSSVRESSSDDHSWILVKNKPIQGSPWEEDIIELNTAARLIRQEF